MSFHQLTKDSRRKNQAELDDLNAALTFTSAERPAAADNTVGLRPFAADEDSDILTERTGRRDTRPLLRNDDPKGTLERLAEERRASYAEAHIRVRSGRGGHNEVVERIITAVAEHLGR